MFCKILETVFLKSHENRALEKHLGVLSDGGEQFHLYEFKFSGYLGF